jgi:hypothetical protein
MKIVEETPWRLRIEREGRMRVPGIVFLTSELLPDPATDKSLEQVANVASLPGILRASYAMPDMHWGYGFPIGGVAATDVDAGGVVSPGWVTRFRAAWTPAGCGVCAAAPSWSRCCWAVLATRSNTVTACRATSSGARTAVPSPTPTPRR